MTELGWSRPFDPSWCLSVQTERDDLMTRVAETLLCVTDGLIGTRGVLEEQPHFSNPQSSPQGSTSQPNG